MKKGFFAAVLFLFLISGCATNKSFVVQINSIGDDAYQDETTYIVVSTDRDVNTSDLTFLEYSGYIKKVLSSKGYTLVDSGDDANIIVFLTYGVGDPQQHVYTYTVPVYGKIAADSRTDKAPGRRPPQQDQKESDQNHKEKPNPAPESDSKEKDRTFRRFTPTRGIVGTTAKHILYTTYFRYCKIEAFDLKEFKETGEEKQLWWTVVTSRGESDDLRYVMPYMITAVEDYIGSNTGKRIEVKIRENDKRVDTITD